MRFSATFVVTALLAAVAQAVSETATAATATTTATSTSGANPFKIPNDGLSFTAGETSTIEWEPTTSGTVTLQLRSGASSNLDEGTTIASEIENSGSYTWTVPDDIVSGTDYTLEIIDDDDDSITNYTPQFTIESDVVAASTSAGTATTTAKSTATTGTSTASSDATTTDSAISSASSNSTITSTKSGSSSTAAKSSAASATSSSSSTGSTNVPNMDNGASGLKVKSGMLILGLVAAALL